MKIEFEVQTEYGLYRDALYFPDDQPLPDDTVIEAMKQERVNAWVDIMKNPPPSVEQYIIYDQNGNPFDQNGKPILSRSEIL